MLPGCVPPPGDVVLLAQSFEHPISSIAATAAASFMRCATNIRSSTELTDELRLTEVTRTARSIASRVEQRRPGRSSGYRLEMRLSGMRSRLALFGAARLSGPRGTDMRRAVQQRRLALLAIIASSPDATVSRDRLLGILWPDRGERAARHLLADSVYVLRTTLGDEAVVATGNDLRLSGDLVSSDVAEFHRLWNDRRWSEALDLYRGDFLDGFYLRDAVDFDHWLLAERARLQHLAARAAHAWAEALEKEGRIADAAGAAERALELQPSDEAAFRNLLRLLTATQNRARAAAVAHDFTERLADELGVSPSAETMRLVHAIHGSPRDTETAAMIARGRHHWHQRTRASLERAITYFARATKRDQRAVEAWSGLADCWTTMAGRGYVPVDEAIARAASSADRAMRLDDTRSAVHATIGGMNIIRRRWRDAESSLRRALAIDPENADAHHWLSLTLLTGFGDRTEAMRAQTAAATLNPVSPMQVGALGWQRYLRADYESSRSSMEPVVDLNADLEEGHAGLARAAARLGDEATVTTSIEAGIARRGDLRGDLLAEQASALAVLGDSRRARQRATEAARSGAHPTNLALAWASVGEIDRAFESLNVDTFTPYWAPQAIWWDPRFDRMRDDSRFRGVRERVDRAWKPEWR
jgi:DNA-binding SARP family transcriptional activator